MFLKQEILMCFKIIEPVQLILNIPLLIWGDSKSIKALKFCLAKISHSDRLNLLNGLRISLSFQSSYKRKFYSPFIWDLIFFRIMR